MADGLEAPSDQSRLSVLINADTEFIVREFMDVEQVSVTEATRRLFAYGEIVWRARQAGQEVILKGDGGDHRVVLMKD